MSLRMSSEVKKFFKRFAREGGRARAAKYDHATLSEWAKRGGRPKKSTAAREGIDKPRNSAQ